jgi:hypothetical protein
MNDNQNSPGQTPGVQPGLAPAGWLDRVNENMKTESDKPLGCEVEGEQLVIRIGVSTLAWAAKKRNGGVVPDNYRMVDKPEWAKDVARKIVHEDEVGNTMLCEMLDEAMQAAMDDGSTALVHPKTKRVATRPNAIADSHRAVPGVTSGK